MHKRVKLAIIVGKMKGGGVEATVMAYLRNIDKSRIEVSLLVDEDSTLVPTEYINELGVKLEIVPPYQRIFSYISVLVKLFKSKQYDIVHAHINTLNVFPMLAAFCAGVPVRIAHNHTTAGKGEIKKNILKYNLRPFSKLFPTVLVACGEYAGKWIYGKTSRFWIMPNSIDFETEKYLFDIEIRNRKRQEFGISDETFVVGHVGRFLPQKNHEFIVKVFNEIYKINNNVCLLLIGNGSLEYDVKKQVKDLSLENNVIFTGQRSDVHQLYQAMDALIFPSLYEGMPLVPVEAQISNLPVISSSNVTKEIIKNPKLVTFLDLEQPAKVWADTTLKSLGKNNNRDGTLVTQISETKSHKVNAENLSDWYCSLVGGYHK